MEEVPVQEKTFYFIGFFHKYKDIEILELLSSATRNNVKNILKKLIEFCDNI